MEYGIMDPFEPVNIGDLTVKNRFVMAPMISNLADPNGFTNEIHTSYLEQRAIGGFGMIVTEYSYIDSPMSRGSRNELSFVSYDQAPRLKRLTERIHSHGTKVFAQLVHAGGKALAEYSENPRAPSSMPYLGRETDELTVEQIEDIENSFLKAAKIAEKSNFDGIELHGAHAYLIQEFLSPSLNKRKDRYGNDFAGRLRFPQEIIDLIRKETGLKIGIRLSLYEDEEDGYDSDYGLKIANSLKNLDYVHFSAGRTAPPGSSASYYSERNHIGNSLKKKPDITTIMVGSIVDIESVRKALEKSDLVAIGRAALADPYFPLKLKAGMMPRPCIRCNQACRDFGFGQVRCTVNPITGNETYYHAEHITGHVKIAGAGVAGMEAAIYLARAGMDVEISESDDKIGGQINEIDDPSKRKEFMELLNFYRQEIKRLRIRVNFNKRVSEKDVDIFLAGGDRYENIKENDDVFIDSNIYKNLDQALNIAKRCRVYITERSLTSLDRHRQMVYRQMAESRGIIFVKEPDQRFKSSSIERFQYDIYGAATRGITAARDYIRLKSVL
ncbi:NADH:flavin oxidoreductase [Cuniculiplasma divulgatum]|uniref:NADH:flavin oxidoreductase n=2 Tax=Cuniculiplasma divulgatum TaxID=1673428 RepID=A0A1N5WJT7_9ARCH|nr:NADH:flavin oxidoreductase [Cuniculiplasma divulgatum]